MFIFPDSRSQIPEPLGLSLGAARIGLAAGLFTGTCAALCFGGLELIHHGVLRLTLRIAQGVPIRLGHTL